MVLLDNGHGKETKGKRSPDGALREWAWARAMAARIEKELQRLGAQCQRIVPEERDVPLEERAARVNRAAAAAEARGLEAVLVSLHCNAAGAGKTWEAARGWGAYVARRGGAGSRRLAGCLAAAMPGELITVRQPRAGQRYWEEDFYILRYARPAAVLTENLFMDNRDDCRMLLAEEWQARLAAGHVAGLAMYARGEEP